jgi:2-dehydro-3-deoxyphosphogluconate aldolase/(4S)-4-hydroxy-2-oxoglutarate aldolase
MEKKEAKQRICETGVIAIIRAGGSETLIEAVEAIRVGGLGVIEVTLNTPGALDLIAEVKARFQDEILFGAGTVLDPESAREAIRAGADFIVSPALNLDTIEVCKTNARVSVPGCFTPTEILTAWQQGADFIKLFPADAGGPSYIKAVRAPLSQVPLVPTGGVDLENMGAYFKAGAAAVAVGGCLVSREILENRDFRTLTERARKFREEVVRAREG